MAQITLPPPHRPLRGLKWLALACAIIPLMQAVLLLSKQDGVQPANTATQDERTTMDQPVMIENQGGTVRWKLRAERAEQMPHAMRLIHPVLNLFDRDGSPISIRGAHAWFDPLRRSARFAGNVTVDYRQWRLQSTEALFDGARGELHIPGRFTAHGDGRRMSGQDLTLNEESRTLTVRRHVRIEGL